MLKLKSIFILVFILIGSANLVAQDSLLRKKEIFFGVGPMAYRGDLTDSFEKWSLGFTVGIKFNRFKKVNGNFLFTAGTVTGQNFNYSFEDGSSTVPTPNRFFRARVSSLHYQLHYNFVNNEKFRAYGALGIGMLRFDPQDEFNESLLDQLSTRADNETYGNITLMFPVQIGALYTLPNDFSVEVQLGYSNTLTDYLDNISNWSNQGGNDNIFSYKFLVHIPVSF